MEVQNIVHPSRKAQIILFITNKVPINIPKEYIEYVDVFSKEAIVELPEYTGINNHPINLKKDKQPPYRPIYSLKPVQLKMLKTYIEDNLKNGFIR